MNFIFKKYFLIILVFTFVACDLRGTETGNPQNPIGNNQSNPIDDFINQRIYNYSYSGQPNPNSDPNQTPPKILYTLEFIDSVCVKLGECDSDLFYEDCFYEILSQSNIDSEIGIVPGTFSDLEEQVYAEDDGLIVANLSYVALCQSDIEKIKCDELDEVFNQNNENNWSRVAEVIPETCSQIF